MQRPVIRMPMPRPTSPQSLGSGLFPNVRSSRRTALPFIYDDLLKASRCDERIYTVAGRVPARTARLVQLQRLSASGWERTFLLPITIDPKQDTPRCSRPTRRSTASGPGALPHRQGEDIQLATKKLGLSRVRDSVRKDGTPPAYGRQ